MRSCLTANENCSGIEIYLVTIKLCLIWTADFLSIFIQKDTCYEGGIFYVDINIPPDYPFKPPKMKFDTKIWHPNVSSQTGAICLDILKNEWTPALTIRTALISLQALMCCPEADDPQDAEVAR